MLAILILAVVAVAWAMGRQRTKLVIARLFGRAIGAKALAHQPDRIRLTQGGAQAWKNPGAANAIADPLLARGFEDAGTFTVAELNGVVVRLLAKADDSLYAAVYEHPKAGAWFEFFSRYRDGSGSTFSAAKETGLDPHPCHPVVHAPGTSPLALYARACAERPQGALLPATVDAAVRDFEQSYADSIAWRKSRGISGAEVAKIARRRAA